MASEEDVYFKNLKHKIREDMQVVWMQFEIMNEAIDKCGDIALIHKYIECANALNNAISEIRVFQKRTESLAEHIKDLDKYIRSKQQL